MTTKPEKQKVLSTIPKAQEDRIKAVAKKQAESADGPPMKSNIMDGVLQVSFTHAERSGK